MPRDITDLLKDWTFDGENNVRRIPGEDGRDKIQIRVDQGAFQGILQMEVDGRPDGQRPHERDFALDYYRDLAATSGAQYRLPPEVCQELFEESKRLYERYIFLLQLSEYDLVVRDTRRNMRLFRFVHRFGERVEDRMHLEKWWPYVLRINGVARAMRAAAKDDFDEALRVIREARIRIESLKDVEAKEFFEERRRSFEALETLETELTKRLPQSLPDRLRDELAQAVESEEYERAARLRDRLANMQDVRKP